MTTDTRKLRKNEAPIRITTASASPKDDIAERQRRYLYAMSLRTICFIGALAASFAGIDWLWPLLVLGAIVLPYFAVVAANAGSTMADGFKLREVQPEVKELSPPSP